MMLTKDTIIKKATKRNSSFLFKGNSQIHGYGIFTNRPINEGETFYLVPLDNTVNLPKAGYACIDENIFVDDPYVLNWVNHSCDPNTILDTENVNPRLVALRNIAKGEEITVDYELTEIGGQHKKPCNCSSTKCRGYFKIIV